MVLRDIFRNVSNIKCLREYRIVCHLEFGGWASARAALRRFGFSFLKFQNTQLLTRVIFAVYSDFPELDSSAIGAAC
jgi:hypothetical protein